MSGTVVTSQLTFDDEFDTFNSSPNGTTGWETRLPYYGAASRNLSGAGEAEFYSDSSVGTNPFSDTNGVLSITATTIAQTGANPLKEPYNSGAITTYHSFSQEYGYFEINAELPAGNGLWSAFWMAPESLDGTSELDGLEVLGNNPSQYYATTHALVNGVFVPNLQLLNVPNTSTAFHTYGFDWSPTTITWYEDGVEIAIAPTPANMDEKMFMIMNLAVGAPGSWPGAPTSSSEFPASYQVNYVRAYATANTKYVSGTSAIGLGADNGEGSITGEVAVGLGVGTAIKGVTVSLLTTTGAVLATTTSDSFGNYQFIDIDPGSYQVKMAPPSGYIPQPGSTGIDAVTLTAGEALTATTLKLATGTPTTGTVAGSVLLDSSGTTTGTAGVTVALLNASGSAVATTTTSSSGAFSFGSVTPGSYEVKYTAPSGEVLQSGPGSTSTGLTGTLTVTAGQTVTLAAETLAPLPATISGSMLLGTSPVAGVTVTLLSTAGATLATTVTSASGAFSFGSLAPGSYQVEYTAPTGEVLQSGPGSTSTGLTSTLTVAAGQTLTLGAETLAVTPATISGSTLLGTAAQAGVTVTLLDATGTTTLAIATTDINGNFSFGSLAPGSYQVDYAAPTGEALQSGPGSASTGLTGVLTVAAGQSLTLAAETLALAPATISGSTLLGTVAQAGVTVTLLDATGTTTLATATTDINGNFSFGSLAPGSYQVEYTAPTGEVLQSGPGSTSTGLTGVLTVAAGQTLTLAAETLTWGLATITGSTLLGTVAQAGVTVTLLDATGTTTLATATTDINGNFSFGSLAPGSYQVDYAAPTGEVLQSGPASISTGLTGVLTVTAGQILTLAAETLAPMSASITGSTLLGTAAQAGVSVKLLNAAGTATVATATTNASGAFSFGSLAPGSYQVMYTAPSGEVLQSGPGSTSTGLTGVLSVAAGQTLALAAETLAGVGGTITGSVKFGTIPEAGVTVLLQDPTGTTTLATATTNAAGVFAFTGLATGYYRVGYVTPSGQIIQSGPANATTGETIAFGVTSGGTRTMGPVTLGTAAVSSLSGSVLISAAGVGGTGAANVSVALVNAAGAIVATTATDANGAFQFTGFPAGAYQVLYAPLSGSVLELGDPADPITGLTAPITLAAGQSTTLPTQDLLTNASSLSSTVLHVGSGDHGTAQSGVGVTLLDGSGDIVATAVTNGAGQFTFGGLAVGIYQVQYTGLPAGEVLSPTGFADPVAGLTTPVALRAGLNFTETHENVVSSSTTFTLTGEAAAAVRGDGSYTVTGAADDSTLTLGNGNQSVTLSGTGDTVTVGQGASSIAVTGGGATIYAAAGADTISVTAGGNFLDAGPGMNFLNTDGAGGDTFMLNASGQGLTTIAGFALGNGDTLDLASTLAGMAVNSDLSNVGSFVTAAVSGGNTTLYVTPAGGSAYAFAQLTGTATSVAQLLSNQALSIS